MAAEPLFATMFSNLDAALTQTVPPLLTATCLERGVQTLCCQFLPSDALQTLESQGKLTTKSTCFKGVYGPQGHPAKTNLGIIIRGGYCDRGVRVWIRIRYVSKPVLMRIRFPF